MENSKDSSRGTGRGFPSTVNCVPVHDGTFLVNVNLVRVKGHEMSA